MHKEAHHATLKRIVDATQSPVGYGFAPMADLHDLVTAGHVIVDEATGDEHGNVAVKATTSGIAAMSAPAAVPRKRKAASVTPPSAVAESVPLPTVPRGRAASNAYPFATLAIGQSFFVPARDARGFGSTVSAASRRLWPAHFVVRNVPDGSPWGADFAGVAGVGVWRTDDKSRSN